MIRTGYIGTHPAGEALARERDDGCPAQREYSGWRAATGSAHLPDAVAATFIVCRIPTTTGRDEQCRCRWTTPRRTRTDSRSSHADTGNRPALAVTARLRRAGMINDWVLGLKII